MFIFSYFCVIMVGRGGGYAINNSKVTVPDFCFALAHLKQIREFSVFRCFDDHMTCYINSLTLLFMVVFLFKEIKISGLCMLYRFGVF